MVLGENDDKDNVDGEVTVTITNIRSVKGKEKKKKHITYPFLD